MTGLDHPWFRPLWRRVLVVMLITGWGLFEALSGAPFWAVLFLALAGFAAWQFFVRFSPDGGLSPEKEE